MVLATAEYVHGGWQTCCCRLRVLCCCTGSVQCFQLCISSSSCTGIDRAECCAAKGKAGAHRRAAYSSCLPSGPNNTARGSFSASDPTASHAHSVLAQTLRRSASPAQRPDPVKRLHLDGVLAVTYTLPPAAHVCSNADQRCAGVDHLQTSLSRSQQSCHRSLTL